MSFAYLPLYTGDYLRDTRTLSMAGHGCYLLLLTYCWDTRGPLPVDAEAVAAICGARSQEERGTMDRVLTSYFLRRDDGWYNPRLDREIARCNAISGARSEAGRKGGISRSKQLPSKSLAIAEQVPLSPSPSPSPSPIQRSTSTAPRASRLAPDWRLPDEWESWACTVHHLEPDRVVRISLAFRDYWISAPGRRGVKQDWLATWRNWVRKEIGDD